MYSFTGLGGACVVAAYRKAVWPKNAMNTALPKLKGGAQTTTLLPSQFKCGVIFDTIAEQIKDPQNEDLVSKVNASYKFKVSGKQGQAIWLVCAKVGSKPYVSFMDDSKAECVMTAKDEDLFDIMSGKVDSMKAFLGGKLKLSGNPTLAMKLKQFQGKVKQALQQTKAQTAEPKKENSPLSSAITSDFILSSDKVFGDIKSRLETEPNLAKKLNAVFKFVIKDPKTGQEKSWLVDCKSSPPKMVFIDKGQDQKVKVKPDCTIQVSDEDFVKIIEGRLNSQTAFLNKQLKVSGNIMLATKLSQFQQKTQSKL